MFSALRSVILYLPLFGSLVALRFITSLSSGVQLSKPFALSAQPRSCPANSWRAISLILRSCPNFPIASSGALMRALDLCWNLSKNLRSLLPLSSISFRLSLAISTSSAAILLPSSITLSVSRSKSPISFPTLSMSGFVWRCAA